jgi:hypothetical protein
MVRYFEHFAQVVDSHTVHRSAYVRWHSPYTLLHSAYVHARTGSPYDGKIPHSQRTPLCLDKCTRLIHELQGMHHDVIQVDGMHRLELAPRA